MPSSFQGGSVGKGGEPTWGNFAYEFGQNFNPWNGRPKGTGYGNVLDRWYNPATKQQVTEKGEHGLMRAGQAALGTAAAAGIAAGGIAAAPTVAGMVSGGGAGTTAAAGGGGAAAASQTPTGQNMLQQGAQLAGNAVQMYQSRVAPTMERIGYKPEDMLHDAYAVGTGHFDHVKGPGWGFKTPSLPVGAPSLPRPLAAWQNMYSSDFGMGHGAGGGTAMARAGM